MRIIAITTALLLFGLQIPWLAAEEESIGQSPAKSRTLQEVIELAQVQGKEDALNSGTANLMGLGNVPIPTKGLRYKQKESPDGSEHGFSLLFAPDDAQRTKPTHLDLSVGKATKRNNVWEVDGYVFVATLDGELKQAFRNRGVLGKMLPTKLARSKSVIKTFKNELEFHQKTVPASGLKAAK
ncbi:MAG: hypothetical protein NTX64_09865 [Elusimicrobia bacterium]|nr:hypothetical protein [Elusimicrobiota bacterium]